MVSFGWMLWTLLQVLKIVKSFFGTERLWVSKERSKLNPPKREIEGWIINPSLKILKVKGKIFTGKTQNIIFWEDKNFMVLKWRFMRHFFEKKLFIKDIWRPLGYGNLNDDWILSISGILTKQTWRLDHWYWWYQIRTFFLKSDLD